MYLFSRRENQKEHGYKQVIKDHDLKFGGTIKFIDGFGELEGKIGNWKDSIVVNKWKEIYERNDATPEYYFNLVFI